MADEKKPQYELRKRSKGFVGLWDGKHCLCAMCVNTVRGALDARLILLIMNSHKGLLAACNLALSELDAIATNVDPNVRHHIAYTSVQAAIASTKPKPEQGSTL